MNIDNFKERVRNFEWYYLGAPNASGMRSTVYL